MKFNPKLAGNETLKQKWNSGHYDKLIPLREELLSISGREMVPLKEPDLNRMISEGHKIDPQNVKFIDGNTNECHENSALLYRNNDNVTEIGTGWALSDDGLWRQHSWAMKESELIETTVHRTDYYGILLSGGEAEDFVDNNVY